MVKIIKQLNVNSIMRKLSIPELNRVNVADYKLQKKTNIIVVLDNIRSGLNVGSFFRTCDAFGLEKIILCGISPRPPHKEITKTAIGATQSVDWEYHEDITSPLSSLKEDGYKIISIEQTTSSVLLNEYNESDKKIALVFGNEVLGVSEEALNMSDIAMEIPQFGTKHSLNVSVCGGVVLWKFKSQML